MTEHLIEAGSKVVATLREPSAIADLSARYSPDKFLVIKTDVTKPDDVTAAFAKAKEEFGRIDVVFNNAGVTTMGEVEALDEAAARQIFDVNFWGAARVSREAVRFFREVNRPMGGRLLQVSSVLGFVGNAGNGFYSASKFALEGLTESLVDELDPAWNIKATLIEPGPFRTEIVQKNFHQVPPHPAYADPNSRASQARNVFTSSEFFDGNAVKAVNVIEKVSRLEDPPIRLPLHKRVVTGLRDKAKGMLEVADKYESWSDDLYND